DIQPLFNGVSKMHPTKGQRRGEDRDVAGFEAVHGLFVSVEADEFAVLWHVNFLPTRFCQTLMAAVEAVLENISHGHELDGTALGGDGVICGAGAATTTADQGDLNHI